QDIPIIWWNSIEPEPNYLQELAIKILAIVPNSTSCERNFSLLNWLTRNRRIQLDIQKLESISKLCIFYNSNTKKELSYFASKISEKEVLEILNQTNTKTFEKVLEKEGFDKKELFLNNKIFSDENNDDDDDLLEISNENLEYFSEENQIFGQDEYDWNPEDLLISDDD
ncbi:13652_t:CDS:2, partial [Dentiscutata erythropus]